MSLDFDVVKSLVGQAFGLAAASTPTSLEVGLLGIGGAELFYPSYTRRPANSWEFAEKTQDDEPSVGVRNTETILWPALPEDEEWEVGYARIWDDAGNVVATVKLEESITYMEGDSPNIPAKSLFVGGTYFDLSC